MHLHCTYCLTDTYLFLCKYLIIGAPKTNRTSDLPLRRGLLYLLSYRDRLLAAIRFKP